MLHFSLASGDEIELLFTFGPVASRILKTGWLSEGLPLTHKDLSVQRVYTENQGHGCMTLPCSSHANL